MSLVDSTCIVRSLKAGLFETRGWDPSAFGSDYAADYWADRGCFTDAATAFDGVNQALSRASEAALQTGNIDFFVCGWVWVDDADTNDLVGKNSEFALITDSGFAGKPSMYLNATDRANWTGAWSTGAWHFVYGYYDSVAQRVGVSVDDGAAVSVAVATPPSAGADPFFIGNRSGNVVPLPGKVGRVGFWKRLPTAAERTWLYNAGAGRFAAEYGVAGTDGANLLTSIVDAWDAAEKTGVVAGRINGLDLSRTNNPGVAAGPGEGACIDRSPCKRIEDQSGNACHLANAIIAQQPLWIESAVNDQAALLFSGAASQNLRYAAPVTTSEDVLLFSVVKTLDSARIAKFAMVGSSNGYGFQISSGGRIFLAESISAQGDGAIGADFETWVGIRDGALPLWTLRVNGAEQALVPNDSALISPTGDTSLGGPSSSPGDYHEGYVARFGVVSRVPSVSETSALEAYLRSLYGTW